MDGDAILGGADILPGPLRQPSLVGELCLGCPRHLRHARHTGRHNHELFRLRGPAGNSDHWSRIVPGVWCGALRGTRSRVVG